MKMLHFYGCSFTAGDELADKYYPELLNHSTVESYRKAKSEFLKNNKSYHNEIKELAYPSKLKKYGYFSSNFAECGASLEEMIYKIVFSVAQKNKPDAVFLQIPPMVREAVTVNGYPYVVSLSLNFPDIFPDYENYLKHKAVSFNDGNFATADLIKLYMLKNFLENQKIDFYLVEMTHELRKRFELASAFYKPIIDEINSIKKIDVTDIDYVKKNASSLSMCGHYNERTHEEIAISINQLITSS